MQGRHRLDIANKKYSVFMAFCYIILCIVAMFSMIVTMYSGFRKQLQNQAFDIQQAQLKNVANSVNSQIDYYMTTLQNIFQEPRINLTLYGSMQNAIDEYNIYRFLNFSIVNDGYVEYGVLVNNGEICQIVGPVYPRKSEQEFVIQELLDTKNDLDFFFLEDRSRFFLFRTERNKLDGPPLRGVLFAINADKFETFLHTETENCTILVLDKNGNHILENQTIDEETLEQVRSYLQTENMDEKQLSIHGKPCFVNSFYDAKNQLTFVQILDFSEINKMVAIGRSASLWAMGGIVIVSVILASILSYVLYRPLGRFFHQISIYSRLIEGHEASGQNQPTVSSNQIVTQFSRMSQQFHTDRVLRFLEDEKRDAVLPNGIHLSEQKERVLLLLMKNKTGNMEHEKCSEVCRILQHELPACNIREYSEENRNYGLVVIAWKYAEKEEHADIMRKMEDALQEFYVNHPNYYLICSDFQEKDDDLPGTFQQILEESRYVLLGEIEFLCDMTKREQRIDEDIPKEWMDPLLNLVKQGKEVEAKKEAVAFLRRMEGYDIRRIIHALSYLSTEIANISLKLSAQTKRYQELYMDHHIRLSSLENLKQLHDYLGNIIEDACLELKTSQERSLRTNMLDALEYINEHFWEPDLSMESVAEVFHISTSYFSRMFHEASDLSFPEYVNELRLEYAAERLQNTNMAVKDIATTAGFSGTSYFSVQFKKKYGISPSAYRNQFIPRS